MPRITFDQLLHVYRQIAFAPDGHSGRLSVNDTATLETMQLIESDERAFEDAAIRMKEPLDLKLGAKLAVEIDPPRSGLGLLARNVDELIARPSNRITEPDRFYVISERFAYNDTTVPDVIQKYRTTQKLVHVLSSIAALVDPNTAELIFLSSGPFRVRIDYDASDLHELAAATVTELETYALDSIHKDQKAAILVTNLVEMCRSESEDKRFRVLMRNLVPLLLKARDGYRLFASEFSYDKIKGKTEEAIGDYTNKIHKTFHDIQNQVMGVPVATVIVATQLKASPGCGVEFWSNLAISIGATLFVLLLSAAIYNQLMTLDNIKTDLGRQQAKLKKEYLTVANDFVPLYTKLGSRVSAHRIILWGIVLACWAGMLFTWFLFSHLAAISPTECIAKFGA